MKNAAVVEMVGVRCGRLMPFERAENRRGQAQWRCRCDCGNESVVSGNNLRSGRTRSCGCLNRETQIAANTRHGLAHSPTHRSWMSMRQRCLNPRNPAFKNYGARGITICARWSSFENFLADMGVRADGLEIERIDNEGNYEPTNCRWATSAEQSRNTRRNRFIEFNGKRQTVAEWSRETGILSYTIYNRLNKNWPPERIFDAPMTVAQVMKGAREARWGIPA